MGINSSSARWRQAIIVGGVALLFPIIWLCTTLLTPPSDALRHIWAHRLPESIRSTIILLTAVGGLSLLIGVGCAWLTTTYTFYGSGILKRLLPLPLALPTYIAAYALHGLVTYGGPIDRAVQLFSPHHSFGFAIIGGLPPTIYILSMALYPYIYLLARHAFLGEARILFEVAASQGTRWPFFRLALPLARPALIGGLFLVAMETLNEYGTVIYFGVETISTLIYHSWLDYRDIISSARIALALIAVLFALYLIERCARRRTRYSPPATAVRGETARALTGWRSLLASCYCLIPVLCGCILPAISLIYWGMQDAPTLSAVGESIGALMTSIAISGTATVLCAGIALLFIYGQRICASKITYTLILLITFGYALPGTVVAVTILRTIATVYLGIGVLIYAYIFRYFAVGYHTLNSAFEARWAEHDAVARTLGAHSWRRLFKVHIPQLWYPIIYACVLIFLDLFKELPLTIILRPIGIETLATTSFYYASEERFSSAALPALLMLIAGLALVLLLQKYATQSTRHS